MQVSAKHLGRGGCVKRGEGVKVDEDACFTPPLPTLPLCKGGGDFGGESPPWRLHNCVVCVHGRSWTGWWWKRAARCLRMESAPPHLLTHAGPIGEQKANCTSLGVLSTKRGIGGGRELKRGGCAPLGDAEGLLQGCTPQPQRYPGREKWGGGAGLAIGEEGAMCEWVNCGGCRSVL